MNATVRFRRIVGNLIADTGSLRDCAAEMAADDADRDYLLREIERIQAAAHRLLAFLDQTEGLPRN